MAKAKRSLMGVLSMALVASTVLATPAPHASAADAAAAACKAIRP